MSIRRHSAARCLAPAIFVAMLTGASSMQAALSGAGSQVWGQFTPFLEGVPEQGDHFGTVVVTGDFNDDGRDDLAVGSPSESVNGLFNAGAVNVIYGTNSGLQVSGDQIWTRDSSGVPGEPEYRGEFGAALAAGDFNHDGYDDLAIGNPGSSPVVSPGEFYGGVNVLYGSASGLQSANGQLWTQDSFDVNGVAEAGDEFGWALAACDFDGDGFDDLAIGVPGEDIGNGATAINGAGAVNVLYGSANRLTENGNQLWTQDTPNVEGVAEATDSFGYSLTGGYFNGDNRCDLAIGVPFEGVEANNAPNAGAVNVLFGAGSGLISSGDQIWSQESPGVSGVSQEEDRFGHALAAGDFNGDGYGDLAVGAARESVNGELGAGAVNVLYGSASGLTAGGNQIWHQGSGLTGTLEDDDYFGFSLSAGDFDDDGFDDLAIGVPNDTANAVRSTGAVNVLYGSSTKLSTTGQQRWSQGSADVAGAAEEEDGFGWSVAAGDFDGDGNADLAIGVPDESYEPDGVGGAGAVIVIYGS